MLQVLDDPSEDNLHMGMHVFLLCVHILLLCLPCVCKPVAFGAYVRVIYSEMLVSLQTCLGLARYAEASVSSATVRLQSNAQPGGQKQKHELFGLTCSCFLLSVSDSV